MAHLASGAETCERLATTCRVIPCRTGGRALMCPRRTPPSRTAIVALTSRRRAVRPARVDARGWPARVRRLRVAYVRFYQGFGLGPDDLGFGYLDLLAQAAVGTVALTLLLGGLVSIWVLAIAGAASWWFERRSSHGSTTAADARGDGVPNPPATSGRALKASEVAVVVVSLLLTAAIAVGIVALVITLIGQKAVYVVGSVAGVALLVRNSFGRVERLDDRHRSWVDRAFAVVMAGAFALVAGLLIDQANSDAELVRKGINAHPTTANVRIASWGAERATIGWTSDEAERRSPGLQGECVCASASTTARHSSID